MAYQVVLHEKAHHEFIAAYQWYEQEQRGLGDKFTSAVDKCLKQISTNPLHYSILKLNYRHIRVKGFPFSVVFELLPTQNMIHVAAIHHARKNPRKRFRKAK